MNPFIIYTEGKGWNRSDTYIKKIRRMEDKLLRSVLPYGEKYARENFDFSEEVVEDGE